MSTQRASSPRLSTRDLAQVVIFAALIAALTLIGQIQAGSVPITLQTLGVLLAGAILGPKKGPLAVLLYLLIGAIGVPVFSGGAAGLAPFVGPTGGFLFGFILAAWLVGFLTARIMPRYPFWPALGITLLGGISVYLIGAPWLVLVLGKPAALGSLLIFVPGDLIKVLLTVLIAKSVHRAWPGLITPPRNNSTTPNA